MTLAHVPPFFSVVIPVHNRLHLLERAVTSVLGQTCTDYEVTVVDDGSNEGEISGVVALGDPRIKLIQQSHLGVSHARNTGMAQSQGSWIAFLDSDDVWKNSHLEELLDLIYSFPNAGMVATSIVETADDEWTFCWPRPSRKNSEIVDYFRKSSRKKGTVTSSSVAILRTVVETVGQFTPVPAGEDLEYWARVALVTPVAKSHQVTVAYLRSNEGTMGSIAKKGQGFPKGAPRTVGDLSPSIKFVWKSLQSREAGICREESLRSYINGGIDSSIWSSILTKSSTRVAGMRSLYVSTWLRYFSIPRLLSLAPSWLHFLIYRAWKLGSQARRTFKISSSVLGQ